MATRRTTNDNDNNIADASLRKRIKMTNNDDDNDNNSAPSSLLDLLMTRTTTTDAGGDLLDAVFSFLEVGELRSVAVTCRTLLQRAVEENQQQYRNNKCRVIGSAHETATLFAAEQAANNRVPCRMVDFFQQQQQQEPSATRQRFLDEDERLCQAVFQPNNQQQAQAAAATTASICCPRHGVPAILRRGRFCAPPPPPPPEKREQQLIKKNTKQPPPLNNNKYFWACGWVVPEKNQKEEDENENENENEDDVKQDEEEETDDTNGKCDFFQWATAQEQEDAMQNGSFVVQFSDDNDNDAAGNNNRHNNNIKNQSSSKKLLCLQAPDKLPPTNLDQVAHCHAYFRRNYQTGYLLIKKKHVDLVVALEQQQGGTSSNSSSSSAAPPPPPLGGSNYLVRQRRQQQKEEDDDDAGDEQQPQEEEYWTMEIWENTTTELQGQERGELWTRPTVEHASPAAARAFYHAAIAEKKKKGFVERRRGPPINSRSNKDNNNNKLAVVQFFLVTYDLTPWLHNNNNNNNNNSSAPSSSMQQLPQGRSLPPQQMIYLGQHEDNDAIGLETLGKFSLSRDGRTLAVWAYAHGYDFIEEHQDDHEDKGIFKVWIFHQKEEAQPENITTAVAAEDEEQRGPSSLDFLPYCKRPQDIFMGDAAQLWDPSEYSFDVAVSADGNMIAGYMSQCQTHSLLQVFDTRRGNNNDGQGGNAQQQQQQQQPLMSIELGDYYFAPDFVQYAFCRENRIALRRQKKEHVAEEFGGDEGPTFPAVIDFTVYYLYDDRDDDDDDNYDDFEGYKGSDAIGQEYCSTKHCFLHDYEQVKREQTLHNSNVKHAFTYPCRCCGHVFVWTEARMKQWRGSAIYACESCSWQVEFPHKDEAYHKYMDILYSSDDDESLDESLDEAEDN